MHHETDMRLAQRGVTLVEMIVAIVVLGILVAITSMFIRNQVTSYMDVAARAELADEADTAVRRMTRDFQAALPNSVRMPLGSTTIIEFVPIKDAGRYGAQAALYVTSPVTVFGPGVNVAAGDQLVIGNLGIPGADFYLGETSVALNSVGNALVALTFLGSPSLVPSPQSRFQVVSTPVTYAFEAATRTLWRYSGYAIQSAPVGSIAGLNGLAGVTKVALATDVDVANSSFSYASAALQRNAIVSIRLALSKNGEGVTLFQQLNIFNSP